MSDSNLKTMGSGPRLGSSPKGCRLTRIPCSGVRREQPHTLHPPPSRRAFPRPWSSSVSTHHRAQQAEEQDRHRTLFQLGVALPARPNPFPFSLGKNAPGQGTGIGQQITQNKQTRATTCRDAERSLRPTRGVRCHQLGSSAAPSLPAAPLLG